MKIAEALLLRKQLDSKVKQLEPLKINGENGLYDTQVQRKNINDNVDEIIAKVPKVQLADITRTYDHYATELRKLDAAIQKANWEYDVTYTPTELSEPKAKKEK